MSIRMQFYKKTCRVYLNKVLQTVIDGGSKDESEELIKTYATRSVY